MTIHIALLRGINVGGKNIIKMADLKRMFEALNLKRVKTYIQSGNVLLESDKEEESLQQLIEHEILSVFGFQVTIILRTASELKSIIENCPFTKEEISEAESLGEGESLYVSMLTKAPSEESLKRLGTYRNDREEYQIVGRDVYLLFHNSIRDSKLASNLQKLEVPSTVRNWKTINKLLLLVKAMEV